jgi:hypothetical protein
MENTPASSVAPPGANHSLDRTRSGSRFARTLSVGTSTALRPIYNRIAEPHSKLLARASAKLMSVATFLDSRDEAA